MQLSTKGEHFIANEEGKKLNDKGLHIPYKCAAGKWTLGYGEVIAGKDVIKFKGGITEEEALIRFRKKYAEFVAAVNKVIRVPLTQNQFDMLVSLAYNIGIRNFTNSTVARLVNNRQFVNAADHFADWNKITDPETKALVPCAGLTARRAREKARFLSKE